VAKIDNSILLPRERSVLPHTVRADPVLSRPEHIGAALLGTQGVQEDPACRSLGYQIKEIAMTYQDVIDTMPPGLDRAILRVLEYRVGKEKAITNQMMRIEVRQLGFNVSDERQIRLAIARLRKEGHLIGSGDKGFWMISSLKEWHDVRDEKLLPLVTDVSETIRIMEAKAREVFGEGYQASLI